MSFTFTKWRPLSLGISLASLSISSLSISMSVAASTLLKEYKSLYRNITVLQDESSRCVRLENKKNPYNAQSCYWLEQPHKLMFFYSQAMMTALSTQSEGINVLSVGLGGGTMPDAIHQFFKEAKVTTVEIDPKMLDAARDFMNFVESPKNQVIIQDARFYIRKLAKQKAQYDVVLLDAFNGEYIPEHLTTQEFLQEVKSILKPKGMLLSNTFSYKDFYHSESVTYQAVFPDFCSFKASGVRTLVAFKDQPCVLADFKTKIKDNLSRLTPLIPNPEAMPDTLTQEQDWDPKARIFTDQFSPANLYNLRSTKTPKE